jgi:alpha-1,3-rhamnosyl/mannosyltransferase
VLAVGTPEPRKNLARLVQAMQRRQTAGAPEQLVLVGADGWGADELPTVPWLHRLGRVDDRTLRSLYQHAAAVAVPSLHEGSGLPVLEAFAAGAPVAAAKVGALPETAGDAAILFDPLDVRALAAAIDEAITDRDRLVPLGHARAASATWSAAAERYVTLYNSLH